MKTRRRLLLLAGLMLLLPLAAAGADDPGEKEEKPGADLSPAQIEEMIESRRGETATIDFIKEGRIGLGDDIYYRLTGRTVYYNRDGNKLTRLNFFAGNKVKYFLDTEGTVGLMIKLR